jgi:hypothetical protein
MDANSQNIRFDFSTMIRNLFFVLLGAGLFLLRRHYSGPLEDLIHSYAGNIFVSFALYFVFINPLVQVQLRAKRILAALLVLALVESFEAFNGFGFMANTYDPVDFIANAVGVGFALWFDTMLSRENSRDSKAKSSS